MKAYMPQAVCRRGHAFTPTNTTRGYAGKRGCRMCLATHRFSRRGHLTPKRHLVSAPGRRLEVALVDYPLARMSGWRARKH